MLIENLFRMRKRRALVMADDGFSDGVHKAVLAGMGAGQSGGLAFNCDGPTYASSNNGFKCIVDIDTAHLILTKKVAGVETDLIDAAITYANDHRLTVIVEHRSGKMYVQCYFTDGADADNKQIGAIQEISESTALYLQNHPGVIGDSGSFTGYSQKELILDQIFTRDFSSDDADLKNGFQHDAVNDEYDADGSQGANVWARWNDVFSDLTQNTDIAKIVFTVGNRTAGSGYVYVGSSCPGPAVTADGEYHHYVYDGSVDQYFYILGDSDFAGSFQSATIYKVRQ